MNATNQIAEPCKIIRDLLKRLEDPRGWKYPVAGYISVCGKFAHDLAKAMDFYYGGHEMLAFHDETGAPVWVVSSKGYYHYVGA